MQNIACFTLFLPLASTFLLKLFGLRVKQIYVKLFAIAASLAIFIASCYILYLVFVFGESLKFNIADFIKITDYETTKWQICINHLNSLLFFIVTLIALMVNIYSASYFEKNDNIGKFYCYLHLFVFFMLLLVSGNNLMQVFAGWEGVGLCSYLLINFWYTKKSANEASYKAFIVNRVGDVGMLIGIFILFNFSKSLDFGQIFANKITLMSVQYGVFNALDIAILALFFGAMAKSAQIFFHIWLPDAMEGPTPASALIHAATMVTAGVILMVKMFPLLELSQISLIIITIIGSITAMLMGAIGIAQFDIKKIVAYSTCSQLGLMFVAIGTGVPSIAIFHLLTHAFFKALLFLGAGSVIHGMHGEQDLRNMGGLLKKMPFTFVCILIGSLALCGVYPLAGYYSKDAIFESMYAVAFLKNNDFSTLYLMSFWFTLIAVLFSGIYSFKIIWYAFFGRLKYVEAHESGFIMLLPMIILAGLSCIGGYIGFAYIGFGAENNITHSLFGAFELMHLVPDNIKNIPTFLGIGGIIISYLLYALKNNKFIAKILLTISYPFRNTLFFNQVYDVSLGKLINLMNILINIIEKRFINKFIGASVEFCKILGLLFNSLQTGRYYHYLGVSLFGIIIILMFVIWGHY